MLAGKPARKNGDDIVKSNAAVFPTLISGIVKGMVNNVSTDVHSYEDDKETFYGENIPEYLKRHNDEEINALNWKVLKKEELKK